MLAYTPLEGKQALSLRIPGFSASWPLIGFAAGAIILLALAVALIVAFVPRHGGRHAHGPRHARPETTSANGQQGVVTGALGDGTVFPQALRPIAVETRPDNSRLKRWARV
jgi:hypothetical protein